MPVRSRQKRERQSDILAAAIEVVAEKGYHQTRISDIADRAGVAYGLVYHYFGAKERVLSAIFESLWERFEERIRRILALEVSCVEKLAEISDYMLDTLIARPDVIKLLVQEIVRAHHIKDLPDLEIVRRIIGLIEDIFREGIEHGELPAESDPRLLSFVYFGAVEMTLTALSTGLYAPGRKVSSRQIKDVRRRLRVFLASGSFGRAPSADRLRELL